jgi:hypothetical protein
MAWERESAPGDWRARFLARQSDVIEHYRRLLRQPMPADEREAILRRVADLEDEIEALAVA